MRATCLISKRRWALMARGGCSAKPIARFAEVSQCDFDPGVSEFSDVYPKKWMRQVAGAMGSEIKWFI